jgi:hypothetical protein
VSKASMPALLAFSGLSLVAMPILRTVSGIKLTSLPVLLCATPVCVPAVQTATPQQAEDLVSGYKRLVDTGPGGMGGSYLALAITSRGLGAPVGFDQATGGDNGGA